MNDLAQVNPVLVGAYVEALGETLSKPSVKQHLAAIRILCDYLVTGGVLPFNPASSVRGPKYQIKIGKTPVLDDDQMDQLLASIDASTLHGLRDRALIAVMAFDFARIGAVVAMNVGDYFQQGKKWWSRLHEKGGKHYELPAHHRAEEYMDAYLEALRSAAAPLTKDTPLFRTGRGRSEELRTASSYRRADKPKSARLSENDALRMVKRLAKAAGPPSSTCNHSFRATCITNFRKNGGSSGKAAQLAAHESERTTRLYDRSDDPVTLG